MAGTFGKRTTGNVGSGVGMGFAPTAAAVSPRVQAPHAGSVPFGVGDRGDDPEPGFAHVAAASGDAMIECPFCAEQILARAKKCRHCGETVDVAMRKAEEAMRMVDRPAQQVFMNAGGGAGVGGLYGPALRSFGHGIHIFLSLITAGAWLPVWFGLYLIRDRKVYY